MQQFTEREVELARAAAPGQTVARRFFGLFNRFCADLIGTRFDEPGFEVAVAISDAERVDPETGGPETVWIGNGPNLPSNIEACLNDWVRLNR